MLAGFRREKTTTNNKTNNNNNKLTSKTKKTLANSERELCQEVSTIINKEKDAPAVSRVRINSSLDDSRLHLASAIKSY